MRTLVSRRRLVVGCVAVLVAAFTVSALYSKTESAACRCPLIYAPVTCDHNKTYPNPCVADCHHAKNCVPSGGAFAQ